MKKIFAVLLIIGLALSLTGCFGYGGTTATEDTGSTPLEISAYDKSFDGMLKYLTDYKFIPSDSSSRSKVYYEMFGADNGVRCVLSGKAFIEFYDFSKADSATADEVMADMKDDGKFYAVEGLSELTAVFSKSGKYAAVYDEKNSYDYAKITDELENW